MLTAKNSDLDVGISNRAGFYLSATRTHPYHRSYFVYLPDEPLSIDSETEVRLEMNTERNLEGFVGSPLEKFSHVECAVRHLREELESLQKRGYMGEFFFAGDYFFEGIYKARTINEMEVRQVLNDFFLDD